MNRRLIIIEMVLIFCTFFLTGYLAQGQSPTARFSDFSSVALSYLIAGIPQVLLMVFIITVYSGSPPSEFGLGSLSAHDIIRTLLSYLGVFAVLIPLGAVLFLLPDRARSILSGGYRWGLRSASQLPLALALSLLAGYREELFFRSYLITRMEQLGSPAVLSVAVTSLLFCLGHLYEGLAGLIVTAVLGAYLAIVFIKVRNLHVVAVAHGLYNFTIFCISLLAYPLLGAQ